MSALTAVRGAIVVPENTKESIVESTRELLRQLIEANDLTEANVAGMFFTATVDLTAAFPALALRRMDWWDVPALCAQELEVEGSMKRVVRAMVFINGEFTPKHKYIGRAAELRPDRVDD